MTTHRGTAAPTDAFIGRAAELAALGAAFDGGARLVTLLGTAGIGKTRLALEYLRTAKASPQNDAACLVDLSLAAEEPELWLALARSLGAGGPRGLTAVKARAAVERAFASPGGMLVVLDNAEHLVDAVVRNVLSWLGAAPGVAFLVTSRERLRVRGETCIDVGPLSLPREGTAEPGDAVSLFVERARARHGAFAPSEEDARRIGELVRALDGIPLAIELAAARVPVLGIPELARRADSGLDAFGRGPKGARADHSTLRAAIQWSWGLLSGEERAALSSWSVFRGGFALGHAEALFAGAAGAPSTTPPLDVLQALADKSMLRVHGGAGAPRFELYFSVREFAREELARAGLESGVLARHADVVIAFATELRLAAERTFSYELLGVLEAERPSLLQAHGWRCGEASPLGAAGEAEAVLALEPILLSNGPSERLEELVNALLGRPDASSLPPALRARCLRARAKARQLGGTLDAAEADLDGALELASEKTEPWLWASLCVDRGILHQQRRSLDRAAADYARALVIYEREGDPKPRARVHGNLAAVHHDARRFPEAEAAYRAALALLRRSSEPRLAGTIHSNLGALLSELSRFDEADDHLSQAEALLEAASDLRLLGIAQGNRGAAALARGEYDRARRSLVASTRNLTRVGDLASLALSVSRLAVAEAGAGDGAAVAAHTAEAMRLVDAEDPLTSSAVGLYLSVAELTATEVASPLEVRRARGRLADAERALPGVGASPHEVSDDVRAAAGLLRRALDRAEPHEALLAHAPSDALVIGPGAAWFRVPGGVSQSLEAHGALRRILMALVRERAAAEGRALDVATLRELGWPGEQMQAEAAVNRVHVALADLRRRGLRAYLRRVGAGYELDCELAVHVQEA